MNALRRILCALALALALVAGPALTALAQDGGVGCQGLSADDCALLQNATTATQRLASVNIPAWRVNLYLAAEQEITFFEARGSATVALPEEVVLLRDTFLSVDTVTPDTLYAFLLQIDANSIQRMLDELLFAFTVDQLAYAAPGESLTAHAALLYKDRAVYLNLPAPSGENAWFGDPVALTNADLDEIDARLATLRDDLLAPEMDDTFDMLGALLLVQQDVAALAQPHITTTRLANDMLDGQPAAVFTSTFNVKDLLTDPDLAPTLLAALQNLAAQAPEMEPVQLNEAQMQLMLTAVNLIITQGTLTINQWVGLDDGYLNRLTLDTSLDIDPSLLATDETSPTEPMVFDLSAALDLTDFDAVAPDDVTTPPRYYPGDTLEDFLVGTPEQVEGVLALGDVAQRTMPAEGDTHIYALPLEAGQTAILTLESDGYPYLHVYNPDAFRVETHATFAGEPLVFTAETRGVYFVTVEAFTALDYTLSVGEAEG